MQTPEKHPEVENDGDGPRLEQWSLIVKDPFGAPETQRSYLNGIVYGHPLQPDGKSVTTSRVLEIDPDFRFAVTRSRKYVLGEMDPEFKEYLEDKKNAKV